MMHLLFLQELFPQYTVELHAEDGSEWAYIKNDAFHDLIKIYYEPEDYYNYYLLFATQHRHTSEKELLIEYATAFANAEAAAIEFYENGRNRFGGEIPTALLDDLTYDSLRKYFGYASVDCGSLTFRVRAWNKKYCFDGAFASSSSGDVQIIKSFADAP